MKIYALYDKVAQRYISTTLAETDQMFVRQSAYAILMDYAMKDIEIYCVGIFDTDLGLIKPLHPRLVPWDSYKFPTSRMEKEKTLTLEQIEQAAKAKKVELLQKTKDQVKDLENYKTQIKNRLSLEEDKSKDKKNKKLIQELKKEINAVDDEISLLKEVKNG